MKVMYNNYLDRKSLVEVLAIMIKTYSQLEITILLDYNIYHINTSSLFDILHSNSREKEIRPKFIIKCIHTPQ